MSISWKKYFDVRSKKGERELLREALKYVTSKSIALDLGAGSLNDSKYLLSQDFEHIIAMDSDPAAAQFAQEITSKRFEFANETFQDFYFQENFYDLINAQYALPFLQADEFSIVFTKILSALKQGGVFCGQFFGIHDSWNKVENPMNFHTENDIRNLFSGQKIVRLTEEELDGKTALGKRKHRHLFHFIVMK